MSHVINIRGTSGSGKTSLARRMIELSTPNNGKPLEYPMVPYPSPTKKEPDRKKWIVATGNPRLVAIGSYRAGCGGCDEYSYKGAHDDIEKAVELATRMADVVVFEGLIVTSVGQRYLDLASHLYFDLCHPNTWLILQPSVEECIRRVSIRNGGKEFKHKNLIDKWEGNLKNKQLAEEHAAIDCVTWDGDEYPTDEMIWKLIND